MPTYDFRILLETVEGNKTSYYSSSFVNTSVDNFSLNSYEVYNRITGSVSASYQNQTIFSGSDINPNFTFKDNTLLSASLNGILTGSITFKALDTEYDRLLRYKFIGEKVTNVLGLPSDQWVYVDQVRLPADDEANIFQGNANLGNTVITDTLTFAGGSDLNSDIPFLIDTGSDRYIKFVDERSISEVALRMGYDVDADTYEISGSNDFSFNIGGVNSFTSSEVNTLHLTSSNFILRKNVDGGNATIIIENSNNDTGIDKGAGIEFKHRDNTSTTRVAGSIIAGKASNYQYSILGDDSVDSNLKFSTANNNIVGLRMIIASSGEVGINNTSPTERLTVGGNISASGYLDIGTISASNHVFVTGDVVATGTGSFSRVESTIVSSSIMFTSGSNIFGDAIGDTHKFNGHITASGDISASNKLISKFLILPQTPSTAGGGVSFGTPTDDVGYIYDDSSDLILGYNDTDVIKIHNVSPLVNVSGDLKVNTHITASGNISSSGANSTFGEVVNLVGEDPRLRLKAIGANHPGIEWHEDSTRKWVLFNDPANDHLTFKNASDTELMELDQDGHLYVNQKIIHLGDTDTFIDFTTDDINFQAGGQNMIDLTSGSQSEITFNEAGIDIDFRVEGDGDANLLFTNAGTDKVGIGTNAPTKKLQVTGEISSSGNITTPQTGSFGEINLEDNKKIKLGTSDDLQIYHKTAVGGDHSIIEDSGTGNLILLTSKFQVKNPDNDEVMIQATEDGAVSINHDNSQKLTTSANGITVGGNLLTTADITASANIYANGNIVGDDSTNISGVNHITASGNISASGTIFASAFSSPDGDGDIDFVDSLDVAGNITASGNISASGDGLFNNIGIGTNSPDEAIVIAKAAARIEFDGTDGGGGEGILYNDSGASERYALHFPGSDKVVLSNRASNGIVEIRANTSDAGASGEKTIATFEDDKVKISGSLNVFSETSGHITASGNISASGNVILNSGASITFGGADNAVITSDASNLDISHIQGSFEGGMRLSTFGDIEFAAVQDGDLDFDADRTMTISASGEVGIGTTSPEQTLEVSGSGVTIHNGNQDGVLKIKRFSGDIGQLGAGNTRLTLKALNNKNISIEDDAGNVGVFVKDGGKVGIGADTTPTVPLQVTGDISASGILKADTGISSSADIQIEGDYSGSSTSTINVGGDITTLGTINADEIHSVTQTTNKLILEDDQSLATNMVSLMSVNFVNIMSDGNNNGTGKVRILDGSYDADTATEVAEFSPEGIDFHAPLHISGTADNQKLLLIEDEIGNDIFIVSSSNTLGKVGIGTSTPQNNLSVSGSLSVFAPDATSRITVGEQDTADEATGNVVIIEGTGASNKSRIFTKNTGNDMHIESLGNNSDIDLSAKRDIRFGINNGTGFNFTEKMIMSSSGNFGIGTSTPGEKLTIEGNISASGVLKADTGISSSADIQIEGDYSGSSSSTFVIGGKLSAGSKSFLINNPDGGKLEYGVLEGQQNDVFYRGELKGDNIICLPKEWKWLVDENTITIQLTSIGKHQDLFVKEIKDNKIFIDINGMFKTKENIHCYHIVHGTRKDIELLRNYQ